MDLSSILSIIHTITIGTMRNFNGGNNGHGLKNVTCKQTFTFYTNSRNTRGCILFSNYTG